MGVIRKRKLLLGLLSFLFIGLPQYVDTIRSLLERFHSTIKSRTKVMRGLHTLESARLFMDGWLVHYNFFRPHMSLRDSTPAQVAGIRFPFRNWKDITEQPYEITSRIPVFRPKPEVKTHKRKTVRRAEPPPISVIQMRVK